MRITIVPHDSAWDLESQRVRHDLYDILKGIPILSIEHVGSTAIPDLLATSILDIDIVLTPDNLTAAGAAMVAAGYRGLGEMGVPYRVGFRQPAHELSQSATGLIDKTKEIRRNTYVIVEGSVTLKNHRDLKRALLEDDSLREEYQRENQELAQRELENITEYCRGKSEIMLNILKSAGWNEEELEEARKANA